MDIVFVCAGNQCRSPVAERLVRAWALPEQVNATSAGLTAQLGLPMAPESAAALRDLGGDDSHFSSRPVTAAVLDRADLVLTATGQQLDALLARFPRHLRRSYLLSEAAVLASRLDHTVLGGSADDVAGLLARERSRRASRPTDDDDVPDPMGAAPAVHQYSASLVAAHVRALIPLLDPRASS